ncbi:P-loop containing nucleoside triphosphate hydrolase protein [Irpex rosettiformis]|uniref:P-loop containing nucleoside triphosphate hydrolase protein n=1 Tax=Irpex rosettiformis TaxID=378272 RepID=A0ACB8UE26_9APHY|nr:P-loop containing nucleoside triphosphate hydrolase protein [Irpex rosettiformis]
MPRIRKKTSKRGTTNQREKIKHKAAETRKKRKKETKKNTQWKSKHKQDPGIPNNLPYKDQILAEVAEKRRQAEEARQLKKEQKKALKASTGAEKDAADVEDEASEGENVSGYIGVSALRASGSSKRKAVEKDVEDKMEVDEEVIEVIDSELGSLKEVLDEADVVVEVLDARDPLAYHSQHLEDLVKANEGQKLLLILNKIDAISRESLSSWSTHLRTRYPTLLFRSASAFLPTFDGVSSVQSKGKGKVRTDDALGLESILSILGQYASSRPSDSDKPLTIAIVGYTNVGKSSLVNSFLRSAALPIYQLNSSTINDRPTTTANAQEVTLEAEGKKIRVIDTPGYSWRPSSTSDSADLAEAVRARDILIRNKGRIERLKDPEPVVHNIVTRASQEDLMLFYNLPAFVRDDTDAFLKALARSSGLIKKGGILDTTGASRITLRDWSIGKFPRYTIPNGNASEQSTVETTDSHLASLYAADEKVLSTLLTRRELRASSGLVRMKPLDTEERKLAVEEKWVGGEGSDDSNEDGLGAEEDEDAEEDDDEEDEEVNDEDEEPEPPASKRKRGLAKEASARPTKKVAFSAEPKDTKQARRAAGARGSLLGKAQKAPGPEKFASKTRVAKAAKVAEKVKTIAAKKAANTPSKKPAAAAESDRGDDAYDFGKFF